MIRIVAVDSNEYREVLTIRNSVLRQPLGLDIRYDDLSDENECIHLAYFTELGDMAGCVKIKKITDLQYQVQQMAVLPVFQQSGVGSSLLEELERVIRDNKGKEVLVEARDSAIAFYKSKGYAVSGAMFEKLAIPHRVMTKKHDD